MGARGPGAIPIRARRRVAPLIRLPQPPKTLSVNAALAWRECGTRAIELGSLGRADLTALELLARTLASISELEAQLVRDGLIITSGQVRKTHPALAALDRSRAQARGLLADFGLTPAGRERLRSPGPDSGPKPWART